MRILSLACCLVLLVAPVNANHIGIFTDVNNHTCSLTVPLFAPFTLYVVALPSTATEGFAFMLDEELPAGMIAAGGGPVNGICDFFCDPTENLVGASRDCSSDDWAFYWFSFIATGPVQGTTCNHLTVINAQVADCADDIIPATGGSFSFVNTPGQCSDCAVATEPTTWGSVKALYR